MEAKDWLGAGFNAAIGVFLGLALNGLLQLVVSGFWSLAVNVVIVCAGLVVFLFLFDGLTGRLIDRVFPSGVRPAHLPQPEGRKPLARLLSLPAGIVLGITLARFGLTNTILGLL